ncbi:MAG TPA: hypothetical protein VGE12_06335 [Noviherbaspirillum sp.]
MVTNTRGKDNKVRPERDKRRDEDNTGLERIASKIAPPGHEVSDEDLKDPGRMTPGAPPTDNRS